MIAIMQVLRKTLTVLERIDEAGDGDGNVSPEEVDEYLKTQGTNGAFADDIILNNCLEFKKESSELQASLELGGEDELQASLELGEEGELQKLQNLYLELYAALYYLHSCFIKSVY